ncbi:tetratricopeptide repeat protein [Thermoflavimicrobium daqui]|nr:tetratricopeptide repeat protein [Thermoflavimicrobium daqui]
MFHNQWLQVVQRALEEIKTHYPNCTVQERPIWQSRLLQIKQSCDRMLESWACVEEEITQLLQEHPELLDEGKVIEDEVFLDESVVRQFRQGQGYYGLTMFHEAKQFFQQVVDEAPDFLLGRMYLGLTLFQENKLTEAAHQFHLLRQTATHEEFIGFAHHMLGCIYVKQGKDEEAIRQFNKTVSYLPQQADAWFNLGACHYRLKEYHEAVPYFYHALSINEDDWESMYYLSSCYRHYKEWESVTFWRLASYEKTNHPRVIESIAQDYEEMGQSEQALKWYRRLLFYHPKSSVAYHGIAWNLWMLGQRNEAFLWLKKGLTLFPTNVDLLFSYVWLSLSQGETHAVQKVLQTLPTDLIKQPLWLVVRSRLFTLLGKFEQATKTAEQLIEQENDSVRAMGYYQKGRTYLEMGKIPEAAQYFQEAHHLVNHWKDPLFFKGICHLVEGKPELTQSCWQQIVQ